MTKIFHQFTVLFKELFRQLYLSVSSIDFYVDVHKDYKGYGIKYIFTLSFLSSMVYVLLIFFYITNLKDYFVNHTITKRTFMIEYVINQLPTLFYDGKGVTTDVETPLYLYDTNNSKIAVIDVNNSLSYKEKIKIPIIFGKNAIQFSLTKDNDFSFFYSQLFPPEEKTITTEVINKYLGKIFTLAQTLYIYVGMPLLIVVRFISNILENFFIITLIYCISKILSVNTSLKTCIRLAMFSGGALVLLQPFSMILLPTLSSYSWILLLWTNSLLFAAFTKLKPRYK